MKKVYDYDVRIGVKVPETKKTYKMILSIHTTIKEIENKICDLLGYDMFSTYFELYH